MVPHQHEYSMRAPTAREFGGYLSALSAVREPVE
jgi:hypothetical protein